MSTDTHRQQKRQVSASRRAVNEGEDEEGLMFVWPLMLAKQCHVGMLPKAGAFLHSVSFSTTRQQHRQLPSLSHLLN